MIDGRAEKGCKTYGGCLNARKGVACLNGKCYKPIPSQAFNERCGISLSCNTDLECINSKCKKARGGACSDSSDCAGTPCQEGYCDLPGVDAKCKVKRDCNSYLYCDAESGTCKPQLKRGGLCKDNDGCSYGYKCYEGKCQNTSYQNSCKTGGPKCFSPLICEQGKCEYRLQEGDTCDNSAQCELGTCVNQICRPQDVPAK